MKYHVKLNIDAQIIEELIAEEISTQEFINGILDNTFDETERSNRDLLERTVLEHYQNGGGAPEILDLEVVETSINLKELEGEVYLNYDIYKDFGCDDFNKRDEYDGDRWDFKIDKDELTIIFSSYDYPEREPDLF